MPTPVSAPTLVVTMKQTKRMPVRQAVPLGVAGAVSPTTPWPATNGMAPTASGWLMNTCTMAMTAMSSRLPKKSRWKIGKSMPDSLSRAASGISC